MRNKLRNFSLLVLLIISFLLLSIAIDSLGEVPQYLPLPRPPFVNQSGGYGRGIIEGDIPIGWDESPTLVEEEVTQVDANCGCEGMPLFNITGVTGTQYLRVKLGESYDGEWLMYNSTSLPYYGESLWAQIGEARKIYISPEVSFEGYIPGMKNPQQIVGAPSMEYFPDKMIFHSERKVDDEYGLSYNIEEFDPDDLMDGYLVYNVMYLQVPYEVQVAVENMTRDLITGIESDYLKIRAIESYLKDNHAYNLDYSRSPDDVDPVLWFLFNSKEGVCIHFNSALVLMARSIGLPMRLVTGYRVDPNDHIQAVSPQQAHAWAEANFKDLGWVTFDATGQEQEEKDENLENGDLISTNTNIIYQDSNCYKGKNFIVTGKVTDEYGNPVSGLKTLTYLVDYSKVTPSFDIFGNSNNSSFKDEIFQDGILCGKAISKDGQFTINCSIPLNTQPGEYGVEVITLGNSIYSGSNTDPPLDVLARSTIECNTSYRVISGKRFTIEGKLLEEETWIPLSVHDLDVILEGGPYLRGNHPSIPSNQVQISRLFSDNEGIFRYNHVFEPGNHKVILDWDGTFYYNGTSRTLNVTAIPLTIDPDPIDYLVRGEANQITGKVHAEELTPESGEGVEIYLGQEYLGAALTDDYGFFSLSYNIPDSTAVSEVQLVYYLVDGYSISQSTVVAIRPTLNYLPRGVGTWKKPFQIEAVIQNDNDRPMRNVDLKLKSGNKSQTLSTDENGRVMFNVFLNSRPDNDLCEFQIEYSGTKYIMPLIISGTVQLNAIINYLGLFLGLMKLATVLVVGYGAYVLVSRRFPGISGVSLSIDTGQFKEEEEEFATGVYIIRSDKARIDIKIQEIEDNLPLVWGVHEPFTFRIKVKSEQPKALYSLDVVGLEDTRTLRIEDGALSEIAIYQNKGLKHISFIYEDLEEEAYAETLLIMHIVDYREEIVRQFNKDFREQVKRRDALNERLTAREMLNRISVEPDSIGIEALNRMVYNFEEATYSHHPITVDNYRDYMQSRNALEVSENAG